MMQLESIYNSPRLSASYAHGRPAVHQRIVETAMKHLNIVGRFHRALDIGCGAGHSTAALKPFAEMVVGIEPHTVMLAHRSIVAPHGLFVVGTAEVLPFSSGAFDIIAAAGSLNYIDTGLFLPEANRVLAPDGVLLVYDFHAGQRMAEGSQLDKWFSGFESRFPSPPRYSFDLRDLPYSQTGLRLDGYEELEVGVPMTVDSYVSYIMSQTSVEQAINHGESEDSIRAWCEKGLSDIFGDRSQHVLFSAYVAYVVSKGNKEQQKGALN